MKTAFTYDSVNHLQTDTITNASSTVLASYTYTLSATGNRTGVTEASGRTIAWGYDNLYRLTGETISGSASANGAIGYTYDAVGNRLSRTSTVSGIAASTSTYDANDRVSGESFDSNGDQLTRDGKTQSFDSQDRLVSSAPTSGASVHVYYDGDGQMVAADVGGTLVSYLIDEANPTGYSQVVEERLSGNVARAWTFGRKAISQRAKVSGGTWATSFFEHDGHGSVVALTDSVGAVTDTYEYDAFGSVVARTGSTANALTYSGEWMDEAQGLQYLRARWYAPGAGRFVSADPRFERGDELDDDELEVGEIVEAEGVGAWRAYEYASSNPIRNVDKSGLESLVEESNVELIEGELAKDAATVSTQAGRQLLLGSRGYGVLTRAWEFGVRPYNALRVLLKGSGLEAHHLIEKRFAKIIGEKASKMLSVAVTKSEHAVFTAAWRRLIPLGIKPTGEAIWSAAKTVYKDHPMLLDALTAAWEISLAVVD